MSEVVPFQMPPRVPAVEPALLNSAVFLFSEYMAQIEAETPATTAEDEDGEEAPTPEIDTRAVLDLFSGDLGTGVTVTLALFLRVTALYRLFAQSPSLARLALDPEDGVNLSETALLAASRLDLSVRRAGKDGAADFDPRAFRSALVQASETPDDDN